MHMQKADEVFSLLFTTFYIFLQTPPKLRKNYAPTFLKLTFKTSDVNSKMVVLLNIGSFAQKKFLILCKILIKPQDV